MVHKYEISNLNANEQISWCVRDSSDIMRQEDQ